MLFERKNPEPVERIVLPKRTLLYVALLFLAAALLGTIIMVLGFFFTIKYFSEKTPAPASSIDPQTITYTLPGNAPMLGNSAAPVRLIEFADFQCPYCKEFFDQIFPELKKDYIDTGKISFHFQNFAFLGDESIASAEAARCAKNQGKFWEYHDLLYHNQAGENDGVFNSGALIGFAKTIGLSEKDFGDCLNSHIELPFVQSETQAAADAGVNSTPTIVVNNTKLEGVNSYSELKAVIEDALENAK